MIDRSDLAFLDGRFAEVGRTAHPVNVFEVAGFPRWETVASNALAYFLDPNERHGFGTAFVDSLLRTTDGWPFVGVGGQSSHETICAQAYVGSRHTLGEVPRDVARGHDVDVRELASLARDFLGVDRRFRAARWDSDEYNGAIARVAVEELGER